MSVKILRLFTSNNSLSSFSERFPKFLNFFNISEQSYPLKSESFSILLYFSELYNLTDITKSFKLQYKISVFKEMYSFSIA